MLTKETPGASHDGPGVEGALFLDSAPGDPATGGSIVPCGLDALPPVFGGVVRGRRSVDVKDRRLYALAPDDGGNLAVHDLDLHKSRVEGMDHGILEGGPPLAPSGAVGFEVSHDRGNVVTMWRASHPQEPVPHRSCATGRGVVSRLHRNPSRDRSPCMHSSQARNSERAGESRFGKRYVSTI